MFGHVRWVPSCAEGDENVCFLAATVDRDHSIYYRTGTGIDKERNEHFTKIATFC